MRQRDRYIHIYSAIEMSLMYRDSWWNTDIRFWRSWPLSLQIMIFIDLEHEHVILWFGGVYVHRMVAPIKYGKGQRLTVFFKFLCMVSWCNEKYWKSGTTKTSDIMAWKNLMANDVIYGNILVFILDVYDYTEVLSWRMFWCSVIEPSQNVDAWMFLWPVTRLGFGWMAWLWRSDTQKDLGILMVWRYPILNFTHRFS